MYYKYWIMHVFVIYEPRYAPVSIARPTPPSQRLALTRLSSRTRYYVFRSSPFSLPHIPPSGRCGRRRVNNWRAIPPQSIEQWRQRQPALSGDNPALLDPGRDHPRQPQLLHGAQYSRRRPLRPQPQQDSGGGCTVHDGGKFREP